LSAPAEHVRRWLELRHAPGLKPAAFDRLLANFPHPEAARLASPEELRRLGLKQPAIAALAAVEPGPGLDADLRWLEGEGRQLLLRGHPEYPGILAELPSAPPLLYVTGDAAALDRGPAVAIVGSRSPTKAGREHARYFGRELARAGFTVISGLARGIDAAAHEGALEAEGSTVAVLGCGPDRVYPKEHTELAARIRGQGAVVSEFPVETPPRGRHFPQRNRIISGLALATLVVEADERSGSLGTARWAAEQGREVLAVPGPITSPLSRGPHRLIREGAKLAAEAADIAEELGPLGPVPREAAGRPSPSAVDAEEQAVLDCLEGGPESTDRIVELSGLTADRVSAILLNLEIRGEVAGEPGGIFTRTPQGLGRS
jgi:DNA processing protein